MKKPRKKSPGGVRNGAIGEEISKIIIQNIRKITTRK